MVAAVVVHLAVVEAVPAAQSAAEVVGAETMAAGEQFRPDISVVAAAAVDAAVVGTVGVGGDDAAAEHDDVNDAL